MNCLNCETEVHKKYCEECGQKASTKRFSLRRLLDREFLSGAFMLNKGLLFTLKALFTRPGHGVREFLQGKRVRYFNAFSLLLLLITLLFFLDDFSDLKMSDVMGERNKEFANSFEEFSKEYPRTIYIFSIPIMAFCSFTYFRKSKVNFAENIILSTYNVSASLLLSLPISILTIFYHDLEILSYIFQSTPLISFAYAIWLYYQFFSVYEYKKSSIVWRALFSILTYFLLQGIMVAVIVGIRSGFNNAFG